MLITSSELSGLKKLAGLSMANHDLVFGNDPDSAPNQVHDLDIGPGHSLALSHHELELGWSHYHHDLVLSHHHQDQNQDNENDDDNDNKLALARNHDPDSLLVHSNELGLSNNQELALVEIDVDHNLDHLSIIDQPHDLALQSIVPSVLQSQIVGDPNHDLAVGQQFADVGSCRRALRDAAIACRFEIQTVKSDKNRFTAKCAAEGCPWRIHAAKLPGVPTFTVRTINETHTCSGINHLGHQQASVQWVANSIEERLRENPHCKPKEILEEIHRMYGITLSYKQAWRGKERIMASVRESCKEGYRLLPRYCEQVKMMNPGSIAKVYGNTDDRCFRRLFISFYASIYGFVNTCRPLIGLDQTLLKSKCLRMLLVATGFDGNGDLFPLAFGVVDEENDENWIWFLSELCGLLEANTENMPRLTILSDRRKGIVDGVDFNFPTAFHGYCMRHLSDSFRRDFGDTVPVNLLWEAAHALTVIEFEAKVLEIGEISQEAAFWIHSKPPRLWATAYLEGTRYGHLTENVTESLNGWILEASGLPIVEMMECVRRQLMTWFNERRETSMQWTMALVPSVERMVAEATERARGYQVGRTNEAEFEVVSPHEGPNVVDVQNRCRGWQLYGLPCVHAAAALLSCRQSVHRFTEGCFTVTAYRKTYSETIHPILDKSAWKEASLDASMDIVEEAIQPPKSLKPAARPRRKRVRAEDHGRAKRVVRCSRCNQTGHFRTTCPVSI